jgi:dihydrofolate reductase
MGAVRADISVSLDGFVAGRDPGPEQPLGAGGERLHEWVVGTESWRKEHGYEGGERGIDDEVAIEMHAGVGAVVMGRGMFGGGPGPWGEDPWEGWWGDEPPFGMPVFVVTHHAREPLTKGATTFTFVTDGVESALEQARAAAGDEDVLVAGGGQVIHQLLAAGHLDELKTTIAPVLLGGGRPLFGELEPDQVRLEQTRVVESPKVTHVWYRVLK